MKRYLSRRDIARMLGVSVYRVASNEAKWGLLPFRERLNARVLRFKAEPVLEIIEQIKVHRIPVD